VTQVALSVLLLVAAGLLVRTLRILESQDTGINLAHVIQLYIRPYPYSGTPGAESQEIRQHYYQQLFERLQSLPGMQSEAGSTAPLPPEFQFWVYFCEASLIRNLSRADLIETNVRWTHPTGVNVCDMIAEGNSPGGTVKLRFLSSSARTFCAMSTKELLFAAILKSPASVIEA
jgi:hypothetical protein